MAFYGVCVCWVASTDPTDQEEIFVMLRVVAYVVVCVVLCIVYFYVESFEFVSWKFGF